MHGSYPGGYDYRNIGTPAGLTVEAYMSQYNYIAGLNNGNNSFKIAPNTTIIIRSSETGEILQPEQ